jgi:hypothetical protein
MDGGPIKAAPDSGNDGLGLTTGSPGSARRLITLPEEGQRQRDLKE